MTTNISKYSVYMMGHPWPEETPIHPTSAMVEEYLLSYAKKYHILEHIYFNSEVILVERQKKEDNRNIYIVTVRKEGNVSSF